MAETFTMKETPVNSEILNSDEQDSLAIAESLEGGEESLLAGKYKSPQELEQAYVELQKKLGEPREEADDEEAEYEEVDEPDSTSDDEDDDDEEVDYNLSEEQAEFLMDMVGGDKAYRSMLDWAGDNFSKEEVGMYDSVMAEGNPNAIFFAIQALQARYDESVGTDGQTLTGRGASGDDDSFKSQAELVAAMGDPRYDKDPAYRRDVIRRLENSDVDF